MRARTFSRIISPMTIYYTRYYLLLLLFGDRSVVIFSAFVRMATKREAASPEKSIEPLFCASIEQELTQLDRF